MKKNVCSTFSIDFKHNNERKTCETRNYTKGVLGLMLHQLCSNEAIKQKGLLHNCVVPCSSFHSCVSNSVNMILSHSPVNELTESSSEFYASDAFRNTTLEAVLHLTPLHVEELHQSIVISNYNLTITINFS